MADAFKCDMCGKLTTEEATKIEIIAPKRWGDLLVDRRTGFSDICKQCTDELCKFLKLKIRGVSYLP